MWKGRSAALGVGLGILVEALWGCAPPERFTVYAPPGISSIRVEKIAVVPFFMGRHPSQMGQSLYCAIGSLWYDHSSVVPGANETLTRMAHELLIGRLGGKVESLDHSMAALEGVAKDEQVDTPLSLARKVGRSVGCDLVLAGTVWRFRERSGGPAATFHPASVAFEIYLIDVRSGEALWVGGFDETQKSLSENIWDLGTFMDRGARWLTANELARFGLRELVNRIPFAP